MEEHSTEERKSPKHSSHLREVLDGYIDEGRKVASDIFTTGLEKMNLDEEDVEKYCDELATKIKANPLKSVLIAGGIGFLLARVFKK